VKKKTYFFHFKRSYDLVYLKDASIENIDIYEFHLNPIIFANTTLNPDSDGFCEGPCLGNGVLNISKCYGGMSRF
jgi:hypothetical protein